MQEMNVNESFYNLSFSSLPANNNGTPKKLINLLTRLFAISSLFIPFALLDNGHKDFARVSAKMNDKIMQMSVHFMRSAHHSSL